VGKKNQQPRKLLVHKHPYDVGVVEVVGSNPAAPIEFQRLGKGFGLYPVFVFWVLFWRLEWFGKDLCPLLCPFFD
jgi:hypothetical protein